jgi:hypothetical protein
MGLAVIGIILAIVGFAILSSKMSEMQPYIEEHSMLFLRTLLA